MSTPNFFASTAGADGVFAGSDVLPHDHRELKPYRGTGRCGGLLAEQGGRAENDGEYHATGCDRFAEHIVPPCWLTDGAGVLDRTIIP